MPLTKSQIIPPTRKRIAELSEVIDNNRQIRAREYERNRRKISQYEILTDVQKPIINVIKGLLEDVNSWDIHKFADGRVKWTRLKWTNLSPLLQQLNRMSRTEAVETLNETKNKIPNAYTQQLDIVDRLARIFAEKPASAGKVTVSDLDRANILAPIAGAAPAPGEFHSAHGSISEFATPASTPIGSPRRPPDFAGTFEPRSGFQQDLRPPIISQPPFGTHTHPPTFDPGDPSQPGAGAAAPPPPTSGIDISQRERDAEPPPPLPDYTPAVPGEGAEEEGLDVEGYAARFGRRPEILKFAADLLDEGEEKIEFVLRKADELAQSGRDIKPTTSELTLIDEVAEIIRESDSQSPVIRANAERKILDFEEAMRVAAVVGRHPEMKERFIERFSSLGSPRRSRKVFVKNPVPYPYRVNPAQALESIVVPIAEGSQPFRAGAPVVQGSVGMTVPVTHLPIGSPIGSPRYVPTLSGTVSDWVTGRSQNDDDIISSSNKALEQIDDRHIARLGTAVYQTTTSAAAPDTTIVRTPLNKINIMGQLLDIHQITPQSVMVGKKRLSFTPNAWKVLTLKDPRSIQHLDLTYADSDHLNKVARALNFKGWKTGNPKFDAVARNVLIGRDPEAREEPAYDPEQFQRELEMTQRSLSARRMPGGRTRGRKPPREGEDVLEETVMPEAWSLRGQTAMGEGIKRMKWNPLKLDERGGLGEISVSLPDLLERMELIVKRKVGGKVMLKRKGVPIDLIRLLTRRYNPSLKYTDEAKGLYKKIIGLSKIPLGQSYSQKENLLGSGVKIQQPTPQLSTIQKAIANAEPDRIMDKMLTDLGTFRNGNRSKMLINDLSLESDFLLERGLIGKEEHELVHKLIMNKSKKLSPELKEFLDELFNV